MEFEDLNFKISVVSALHDLGYYTDEAEAVQLEHEDWDEDHKPIPAVVEYYRNLNINPDYLAEIDSLRPDGGDLCYQYLFNVWDGEDNQFDITSLEGIEHLINLKTFDPISMIANDGVDYAPLLRCAKLETVSSEYIKEGARSEAILKELAEKGVELV